MPKNVTRQSTDLAGTVTTQYDDGTVTVSPAVAAVNDVAASRDLTSADFENILKITAGSGTVTMTIPNDSILGTGDVSVAFYRSGAAALAIAAGAGVTLRGTAPTVAQYGTVGIMRVGANEWAYIQ